MDSPHTCYVLKFGSGSPQKMEIRRADLSLIGVCQADDSATIATLLTLPSLPDHALQQISDLPHGRLAKISL
ncbi:MAG: hypothetical protein U0176_11805 [Bacteroidia bacterium]